MFNKRDNILVQGRVLQLFKVFLNVFFIFKKCEQSINYKFVFIKNNNG